MLFGTTNLVPLHKHSVSIAQNTMEVFRNEIQFYNGYRTLETKNQWPIKLGLGGLNYRVSEKNEWLSASTKIRECHYERQNDTYPFHRVQYREPSEKDHACSHTIFEFFKN